ncbi:histidine ammonia-lyase [Rhipicephalus sanguineus]|uniref:histidine ammonia-lyase n=1 Tax=Rhipicephalus sanguineus TaxID=34632 RepID=UPI001894F3E7|nr:histidine ammonia-lyase [Rhipicephalus sanguineus]
MKVSVRVRGEWLAVPCRDGRQTVRWLGEEALRRYMKLKPSSFLDGRTEKVYQVRKTRGGAIIDGDDIIRNVLDDNEFLSVVLETDRPSPVTGPAEITYVPEQVYPFHYSYARKNQSSVVVHTDGTLQGAVSLQLSFYCSDELRSTLNP